MTSNATYDLTQGKRIKILSLKQMFHRLPIAFAQVKLSNTYESLLKKIQQIMYSLYRAREIP